MIVTHKKTSPYAAPDDATLVSGPDWNDTHRISGPRVVACLYSVELWNITFTAGLEMTGYQYPGQEPEPGLFVLRLTPSSGASFNEEGLRVVIEPNNSFPSESFIPDPPPPPPGYAGLRILALGDEYEVDDDGNTVTNDDGTPNIIGKVYRADCVDGGGGTLYLDDGEGNQIRADASPYMAFKITVWGGVE
jgi:hypothetical protein